LWQYVSAIVLLIGVMAIGFSASRHSSPAGLSTDFSSTAKAMRSSGGVLTGAEGMAPTSNGQDANLQPPTAPVVAHATKPVSPRRRATVQPAKSVPAQKPASDTVAKADKASLHIRVEHHLEQGELYLWVDDKLTYKHALGGSVTKRLVVFKGVQGFDSSSLEIEPGQHRIRVRVQSSDSKYDESRTIIGTLPAYGERVLEIDCHRKDMRLALQ
jgi:hypothetical protein